MSCREHILRTRIDGKRIEYWRKSSELFVQPVGVKRFVNVKKDIWKG